ncbi:GrdX family protein [Syntrophomonas curvata]
MGLRQVLIITNNPMVKNTNNAEICFVTGDCRHVLYQAFNKVAMGHRLLSHPLAGSIKPETNPYRSVVLSRLKTGVELSTLAMLERCLEKVEAGIGKRAAAGNDLSFAQDFQMIDKELLEAAMQSLGERQV